MPPPATRRPSHYASVGVGVLDDPPHTLLAICRAAPMCAAAGHAPPFPLCFRRGRRPRRPAGSTFWQKIPQEFFASFIRIFSQPCGCCDAINGAYPPKKFQIRSHSGGHPPPRKAMQGQAQADRLCFGAHFSARTAPVTTDHKKENQNFYGRKTENHPSGRPQRDR